MRLRGTLFGVFAVAVAFWGADQAKGQTAPPGAIFDMATAHPSAFSGNTYVQFTTSFVASATSEFVSFAFREAPAYWSFDDISVVQQGGSTNLLADPDFEQDTPANVLTNFPVGWQRWIQPVDTSAIGVVASTTQRYGCGGTGPRGGTYFWCDGSVQGYDALYQQLNGLTVGATYNITFWAYDNSGSAMTVPSIDMLVYAGTALPVGTQPIGPGPSGAPIPASIWLVVVGLSVTGIYMASRGRRREA